jgi:FKBP-type peptidyl-prolyl cis-trans isomerase
MNKIYVWVGFPVAIGIMLLLLVFMGESTATAGVKIEDVEIGKGPAVKEGDTVTVHYTGELRNGKVFDSSLARQKPFVFKVGEGTVIKGWEQGVIGMRAGGVRKLVIAPELAYGKKGRPGIPPDSELLFEIKLLDIE